MNRANTCYELMNPSLFIHQSSFSSFNHHHQTKNHHKQTCNRATLKSFSVKKNSCSIKKRQNPRKKDEIRGKFRGSNSAAKTQIPRLGSKFHRTRKTVGPSN